MNTPVLTKNQISATLEPVFRLYNVRRATLFGSYAKDTASPKSDVDLFVDSGLKGMRFVGLIESIREALGGRNVDVIDESHVDKNSNISDEINKTGVVIYAR